MIDLLGLDAERAIKILSDQGFSWVSEVSEPPGKQLNEGYLKVIKQKLIEGTYRLTLCKVPDSFR